MDFDLAEINYAFARNYCWMSDPAKINDGDCFIWAYVAHHLVDNSILCSVKTWYGCHAFIKVGNKYYDSESLTGEDQWQDLKYFKRNKEYHPRWIINSGHLYEEQSKNQFEKFWEHGDLYGRWHLIYEDVGRKYV